jgi:hypothetical protein
LAKARISLMGPGDGLGDPVLELHAGALTEQAGEAVGELGDGGDVRARL